MAGKGAEMRSLKAKIESQDAAILQLQREAVIRDNELKSLHRQLDIIDGRVTFMSSLMHVKDRVLDELKQQLSNVQQYTRRYSVIISGIEKNGRESHDTLRTTINSLIEESGTPVTMDDVDKFHRNGPIKGNDQDIILRFKYHSAKETFYKGRKNIRRNFVKIHPSMTDANRKLLEDCREALDDFFGRKTEINPPHFVYADVHGNVKLKMEKEVNLDGSMFRRRNQNRDTFNVHDTYARGFDARTRHNSSPGNDGESIIAPLTQSLSPTNVVNDGVDSTPPGVKYVLNVDGVGEGDHDKE